METAWMVALEASALPMAYTITPTIVPTTPCTIRPCQIGGIKVTRPAVSQAVQKMANSTKARNQRQGRGNKSNPHEQQEVFSDKDRKFDPGSGKYSLGEEWNPYLVLPKRKIA